MRDYEKLWNDKKLELARQVKDAPNSNSTVAQAKELAEMVIAELEESRARVSERKPVGCGMTLVSDKTIPEEVLREVAGHMEQAFKNIKF